MKKQRRLLWISISFVLSVVLMASKFVAYFLTFSNAILTDAIESIINVIASAFAFYSVYLSSLPKDENHPYGHGKAEFFSAGFEGALIILAGLFIVIKSIENLIDPQPIQALPQGILILSVSIIGNFIMGYILLREGKRYNSIALIADGKHLTVDAVSTLVLIVGVGIMYLTEYYLLDSIMSIIFAAFIVFNGYKLVRESIGGLMDEVDSKMLTKVVNVLNDCRRNNWIDLHNLRIQKYGADLHIDCHLTLPFYFTLTQVHDELEALTECLQNELGQNVEIFTHADPCIPGKCCSYCKVENCSYRKQPNTLEIPWNKSNLAKNQKHYLETLESASKK